MTQQHDPLHDFDAQQRAHDFAEASDDGVWQVASLFYRARITYLDIEAEGGGFKVTVPPQKGIVGRCKRLNDEMTDAARFSVAHGTDGRGEEYYRLVRLK